MSRSYGPVKITSKLLIKSEFSFTLRIVRQFSKIYVLEFSHLFSVIICDITILHRTVESLKSTSLFTGHNWNIIIVCIDWQIHDHFCSVLAGRQMRRFFYVWRDVNSTLDNLARNLLILFSSFTLLTLLTTQRIRLRYSQVRSNKDTVLQCYSYCVQFSLTQYFILR